MKIIKGDNVVIIAGKDRGKQGKVLEALPSEMRVLVEGVNKKKKHERARRSGQKGQIVEKTYPVHVSNVMIVDSQSGLRTRVGYKVEGGKKVRIARRTGAII
jgi:large subunit ribosomal protein L24